MSVSREAVIEKLKSVKGPDFEGDIVTLGLVSEIFIADGKVFFSITVPADRAQELEPLRAAAERAVKTVPGVTGAVVALTAEKKGGGMASAPPPRPAPRPASPPPAAARPGAGAPSPTSGRRGIPGIQAIIAVASGKGGVGKSTTAVNLALALAATGLKVGLLDADIYGHSVPRMMGVTDRPTQVDSMIVPPVAHDVRVISIAMFTQGNTPVVWRGPMLHRALQQFLADVYWGDLDVLLLDLPPGTGDVAISVAQLIPSAEILVVTTPQLAAAEVAERAGAIALQTRQRIVGVVENMAGLQLPDGTTMQIFGEGGGNQVAERLTRAIGADVPLLGQVPLDPALVAAGDSGVPLVLSAPDSAAGKELRSIADKLSSRKRGLAGMSLGLDPARR